MKKIRQNRIKEIIENEAVSTQEELMQRLNSSGYPVTQATVSRDIKAMKLHKIQDAAGAYRYVMFNPANEIPLAKTNSFLTTAVKEVNFAGNIVVVKCKAGMASAVCVTIEEMDFPDIAGTLAGEDTIFVLAANERRAESLHSELNGIINSRHAI